MQKQFFYDSEKQLFERATTLIKKVLPFSHMTVLKLFLSHLCYASRPANLFYYKIHHYSLRKQPWPSFVFGISSSTATSHFQYSTSLSVKDIGAIARDLSTIYNDRDAHKEEQLWFTSTCDLQVFKATSMAQSQVLFYKETQMLVNEASALFIAVKPQMLLKRLRLVLWSSPNKSLRELQQITATPEKRMRWLRK